MKGNLLIFATLCLLLCWIMPVDSMTIRFNFPLRENSISLSMVEDSVDDMYYGCNDNMMKIVQNVLKKKDHMFSYKKQWDDQKGCAKTKFKKREVKALTKDHMQAICVYTDNKLYREFNNAVRINGNIYSSSFPFLSLHYLLTSAIHILNNNYHCRTTYRRSTDRFTGKVNQIIRFGSFTSSSNRTDLTHFGRETCFIIKTCSGASLKKYSVFPDEDEVLIPPYEMFKITEIINGQNNIEGLKDCKVVFVLDSAGGKSNLNCKVAHS
ncbi:erythroblast NAD(P)(+)--arginine ADP-ribosyltransferase-like [Cottoperca gobio]|uniref:NAD(P)(+)--arginine ADP-ribosyltransferase n=1 Tax=Cottoperca gobio TaxID=56716 RepID=A0A6J2QDH9_COTGO|nr:erythroblast NAD(P)(+)--arginine ADP-ribosyltransferase-like [Cottoperca gobio]